LFGPEIDYIRDAIGRRHLSGDGYYTKRCSGFLESFIGAPKVLLTPSGTHALELAALLLDLKPGDEVLVPSFTFPSTVNAFLLRGVRPRFVDIRPDTLNLDAEQAEAQITKRTRAIAPVHYAGVPCDMARLVRIARKSRLPIIEDAAHALGSSIDGRLAGTFGALSALSFHETKNVTCGEGGALILMDPRLIARAEIVRQKGTNRSQFLRGVVDKYSWVDVGSSYVPSELQSAYLWAQLERLKTIQQHRRKIFQRYAWALKRWEDRGRLRLPVIPPGVVSSHHLFHILLDSESDRNRVMDSLTQKGIASVFHYFPLHLSLMGRRLGYRPGQFPVTEDVSRRLLRLPLYNQMTDREQSYVLRSLDAILR